MAKIRSDYEKSLHARFTRWLEGDSKLDRDMQREWDEEDTQAQQHVFNDIEHRDERSLTPKADGIVHQLYLIVSFCVCAALIAVLLSATAQMPIFTTADNPTMNEVAARYIENGLKETGAVNMVAGMILDYRAFDTLGESNVLFVGACAVIILLHISQNERNLMLRLETEADDRMFEPKHDLILQVVTMLIFPFIMLFGAYVVLFGHISPGGGFSGGAVMGAGLILYLTAYGFAKTGRFFSYTTFKAISFVALTFYALAKTYSFFTGANHLHSFITPGIPGHIFSAGLIPYLNIAVGLVVMCTMYALYALFRKGDI